MPQLQDIKVNCSKTVSSAPILILAELTKNNKAINIEWGPATNFEIISKQGQPIQFTSTNSISRFLVRTAAPELYGETILQRTEVDHWLEFSNKKYTVPEFGESIQKIDKTLSLVNFLVGDAISLADVSVWCALYSSGQFHTLLQENTLPQNVKRWFSFLSANEAFIPVLKMFPQKAAPTSNTTKEKVKTEDKGKFVELPGAEMGKVVVRFPPEASGYLHIGHAKAALLNAHYQVAFQGKLIMRFDDTNPEKEKEDFEKVILEDVSMLQIKPDLFTYTSDHFDFILQKCEELLKSGHAYVDDTDPETMKNEREQRKESKNRNNELDKNWKMWEEMKKGTEYGKTCCVRAKINMASDNGCLRDPTLYRCKAMPHPRKGDKYKVYPTYDFACPIVDSIEGVTHALRTTEYHDRDEQFFWVIDVLKMRKPHIYEYSRLNMTNTVLSKRKLTWFVNEGIVDGWDDPRMPTVRGVLRRGMTVEGLKQFIVAQGSSRSVVVMEWDKIWSFNKKVIDPISPRYNAVEKYLSVPVIVENTIPHTLKVAKHPKNPDLGMKDVSVGPNLLIDRVDAEAITVGENVTFINWGNLLVTQKKLNSNGHVESIVAKPNLDNKDYKKTLKVTWICDQELAPPVPVMCVYYDHLISKPVLGKDEDFKHFLNKTTKIVVDMIGDADLQFLKKGEVIQIQRKGFFICDEVYDPSTIRHTGKAGPVVLFYIPDGTKDTASLPDSVKSMYDKESSQKEKITSMKGKDFERSPLVENVPFPNSQQKESNNSFEEAMNLHNLIQSEGNLIRKLKSEAAEKSVLDGHIKSLLSYKSDFKKCTGKDWVPGIKVEEIVKSGVAPSIVPNNQAQSINDEIKAQGDLVRKLKSDKADKNAVQAEVLKLLKLKADFKNISGMDWKPDINLCVSQNSAVNGNLNVGITDIKKQVTNPNKDSLTTDSLNNQIQAQGDVVRKLKSDKAEKSQIDAEVQKLLKLKNEYKAISGKDWKPPQNDNKSSTTDAGKSVTGGSDHFAENLNNQIQEQGDVVKKLKADKADKSLIDAEVQKLLKLKNEYNSVTGNDWKPVQNAKSATNEKKQKNPKSNGEEASNKKSPKPKPTENKESSQDSNIKKVTRLGLEIKKEENLADWYSQVLTKAEMIEYYDVSGCYILRPWAYSIWESIQKFLDTGFKKLGVTNCYFPMFVTSAALEREKTHIDDFAPEVAWVTKSGSSDMEKPIAIRPTSETVMYPSYAKWIRSHRDLPLRLNQWCNVVRWEFKNPQPFIRTREFLWQEGHTAFAVKEEAVNEVHTILDLYAQAYETMLAVPVIKGRKTEKEKFAGADFTTTTEAFIPASGRGLQGATSHHLGQNFSKMFEIIFEDPDTNEKQFVYQNSWGFTTRSIGAMVMIHADNTGLVLPPRVAAHQVVIVPCGITATLKESDKDALLVKCSELESVLQKAGVSVKGDYRDNYSPGWKFNHWELKGIPIRIELGPKDMQKNQFVAVRRDTGEKITLNMDSAPISILELLDDIHHSMYNKAKKEMDDHLCVSYTWADFCNKLDNKCIMMAPFCGGIECEEKIKQESAKTAEENLEPGAPAMGAKSLCIPFEQPSEIKADTKCINPNCSQKPKNFTLFGRSY